jgi:hypothetical protein
VPGPAPDLSEIKTQDRVRLLYDGRPNLPRCTAPRCPAADNAITQPGLVRPGVTGQKHSDNVTINPAAMPAGTELSFGYFQLSSSQETAMGLIDTNSYTRASAVPKIVTRQ